MSDDLIQMWNLKTKQKHGLIDPDNWCLPEVDEMGKKYKLTAIK